ncbi:MAG: hypothetical protein M1399_04845 [Actinobacteria bacterium]|nr:hypothetical protein [Actinomycetota bacterium]MCL5447240.1 hypothetical protein [Actinomycetota bacterium]
MRTIALFSGKGSPGVTTLACCIGAVWPSKRRVVLMEADPAGGDLSTRFLLASGPGVMSLALSARSNNTGTVEIDSHVQQLPGGLEVLVGPSSSDSALSLDREVAVLSSLIGLSPGDVDIIADCGRLSPALPGQMAVVERADVAIMVLPPQAGAAAHAEHVVTRIDKARSRWQGEDPVKLVVCGRGEVKPEELAAVLDMELLGAVPDDYKGAAIACGQPGSTAAFARSAIIRSAASVVENIIGDLEMVDRRLLPPVSTDYDAYDSSKAAGTNALGGTGAVTGAGGDTGWGAENASCEAGEASQAGDSSGNRGGDGSCLQDEAVGVAGAIMPSKSLAAEGKRILQGAGPA